MIGLDTSHCTAFTGILNDPNAVGDVAGFRVVAAYPGGSPDIAASRDRIEGFTKTMRDKHGVEIVGSIDELVKKVDAVMIESVDGRPHLPQARPVIEAKKPLFIDKPMAGSLVDAIAIAELAKKNNVPWFSSSSLRFGPEVNALKTSAKVGEIVGVDAWSPCPIEEHHPDLFWYGIHGCELLYTLMGPGCVRVSCEHQPDADMVTGTWKDGRTGTVRGTRKGPGVYGFIGFAEKGTQAVAVGTKVIYKELLKKVVEGFANNKAPVDIAVTLEMVAFMEAANKSAANHGAGETVKI